MIKNIKNIGILLLLIIGVASCTKAVIEEPQPGEPITRKVTYDSDIQQIMYEHCITCHGGAAPSAGLSLTTYADTKYAAENSSLVERMKNASSPMPPNGLLSPEIQQIMDKWAEDGFPEN